MTLPTFITDHLAASLAAVAALVLVIGAAAWFGLRRAAPFGSAAWAKVTRGVSLAVRSLWLHKLRAFLSVLGIIIGTASVIALMAFGEGSMQDALEDIKRQGATNIMIRSVKPSDDSATASRSWVSTYGITHKDYARFTTFGESVLRMVPMRVFPSEVRNLDRMFNGRVVASTPEYADVTKLDVARGRFLTDDDDKDMRNVCVLGAEVADRLFPFEDPVGKTVGMRNHFFQVVGVTKDRMPTAGAGGSQAAEDFNKDVYIPLRTSRRRFGDVIYIRAAGSRSAEKVDITQVTLTVSDIDKVRPVGDMVRQMLEQEHGRKDWAVTVPLDRLEEAERAKDRATKLMAMIASISLLVGGIGIMNIMLATVTERTREIGIRRALGAKRKDITLQFLIEAVVQTTTGGLAGVVIGLAAVYAVPFAWEFITAAPLPAKVHVPSIFLAIGFSILVGVVFGLYPAWRASQLDPIEALRHV